MSPPMEGWHASAGVGMRVYVAIKLTHKAPQPTPAPPQGGDAAAVVVLWEGIKEQGTPTGVPCLR